MRRLSLIKLVCLLLVTACAQSSTAGDAFLNPTQLRYRLDTAFKIFFCDPDYYPIARGDEKQRAVEQYAAIASDPERFAAILEHLGWTGRTDFTADEKLTIYREHKRLNSILLEPAGNNVFTFQLRAQESNDISAFSGEIERNGRISVSHRTGAAGACPICLSANTRIATPNGDVRVRDIATGMFVWSLDEHGVRVARQVVQIGHTQIPGVHRFVHIVLDDKRELFVSPGHPTSDGRLVRDLRVGDFLDGARVSSVLEAPVTGVTTYDLLPDGPTGAYFANGVAMGSSLKLSHRIAPPLAALIKQTEARARSR